MNEFLAFFAFVMLLIVICVVLNEKTIKMPPEIALLAFAMAFGILFKLLMVAGMITPSGIAYETISTFNIDNVLMNALLCFMLFSGSSDLKFKSLLKNFKPILLLSLLTTVITALVYGALFYGVALPINIPISFATCVLLGAIVSPTDPIAATGILNKLGLSDEITAIMEGESLFNDGTGVALFVFVKGIVTHTESEGFFVVMTRELLGAILAGLVVSFLCSQIIKITNEEVHYILLSLFAVSFCYALSSVLDFSGAIASVVCGIYFTTIMDNYKSKGYINSDEAIYLNFWSTIDKIFNYTLYILIGISFIYVNPISHIIIIGIAAIIINFIARYLGVYASTLILRKVPNGYSYSMFTTLMTWSGLKGGLCLALVMSISNSLSSNTYNTMLYIVFVTILFTTVIQGLTVSRLYLNMEKSTNSR